MNKNNSRQSWISGIMVAMVFLSFTIFSCKKDGETKAFITVNDSLGNAVDGASVTLWQDTSQNTATGRMANIRVTKNSDSNGHAEFVFALEAYLNITATKGNYTAKGFIRLKEHETINQTVHF